MKLVEILAREWKEWPYNCEYAVCDKDGEIRAIGTGTRNDFYPGESVDVDDRLSGTAFLVRHNGKEVTRADWEAERARIAGIEAVEEVAQKVNAANKDGWISHRGGKCPVEKGVRVDVRYRSGMVNEHVKALESVHPDGSVGLSAVTWDHYGSIHDIMAYRLHKPAENEEIEARPIESPTLECQTAGRSDRINPIQWRDRITEIDATTSALATERAELVQKLADEGFALIGRAAETETAQPDPGRWMIGDSVECISSNYSFISVGTVYVITGFDRNMVQFLDDDGTEMEYERSNFKFHSRPSC